MVSLILGLRLGMGLSIDVGRGRDNGAIAVQKGSQQLSHATVGA
jgi:hypothetical protein